MMQYPLVLGSILKRAYNVHPEKEIVSKMNDESIHRYTYGEYFKRTLQLMSALKRSGVSKYDRIATFALNHYMHFELYFAVPCNQNVLHTLNIRLFPEQLEFIVNHAEDKYIFIDKSLTRLIAPLVSKFKTVQKFIIMDDKENVEPASLPNAISYEEFLSMGDYEDGWNILNSLQIDENDPAGMCYTSGTTGNPKGVIYSHRTIYLHSMGICLADALGLGERETVLPVVPMFHANAWGIPFACVMTGAKLVFPGKHLLGHPLAELLEQEQVTIAAGVPTVWNVLYQQIKKKSYNLKLHTMVVGGSAAPRSMIENYEKEFGINILHAWGMTEISPLGTVSRLRSYMNNWDKEKQYSVRVKQGFPVPGVEIRAIDDNGKDIPRDGKSVGELIVRGAWITDSYYNMDIKESFTEDGWFRTGDVVAIDEYNYIQITDRKKDLIKTRGEWVSSVEMENVVMGLPFVLEAAVVGRKDPLKEEAPVVFCVPKEGAEIDKKAIIEELKKHFAHWQIPHLEDIHVVESIPKTSVGKFDKKVLRIKIQEMYKK